MSVLGDVFSSLFEGRVKKGAKNALMNISKDTAGDVVEKGLAKVASKGDDIARKAVTKIPVSYADDIAQEVAVKAPEMQKLYRGIKAETPEELEKYIADMMDPTIKPRTYEGSAYGEGYYFTPAKGSAEGYASNDLSKPYQAVLEISTPKNRYIGINKQNKNRIGDFVQRAEKRVGGGRAMSVGEKDYENYLKKNGILGNRVSDNISVITDNDALKNMKVVGRRNAGETPYWTYTDVLEDAQVAKELDNATPYLSNTMYHSTNSAPFSKFEDSKLGSATGYDNTAFGHFITDDVDFSKTFGKNTLQVQPSFKNPITHPMGAQYKYSGDELDKIVEDYFIGTNNTAGLDYLKQSAAENGQTLWEEFMDTTIDNNPYDFINSEKDALIKNGYDAVEFVEGPKNQLKGLEDNAKFANSTNPVSSYAVFNPDDLKILGELKESGADKYLGEPKINYSLAGENGKFDKLLNKAKNYKSLDRFEKMNNPIKGSEIWGEKPKGIFERDSRAVRINMFPNDATKGTGLTKQYLLNLLKDAYDQGITRIVPSYGSYTKEGASFMDHLAEQGWVKANGNNGFKSYEIAPKIAEWEKTTPLADIFNKANNPNAGIAESKESLVEMARRIKKLREIESNSHTMQDGVKRIGSANVAPVDPSTLPDGWKELEEYLDNAKDRLEKELGKPRSSITKQDLIDYLEEVGYETEGTKDQLWKNALMAIDDNAVDELYNAGGAAGMFLQERLPFRAAGDLTDATNYYIGNKGRTGRLDAEYSDRLGIGRSNTPMSDNVVSTRGSAQGSYSKGGFGTNPMWATGESGVSTAAHERMHAWQDINKYDWDERVVDAIDELREELKKYYHDEDTIKKYHGTGKTDYYARDIEQEARMLQSYLDNEGYTDTSRRHSERGTEWGNEIKPAFDKFFDKLRALSKSGVALPAIAAVFGLAGSNGKDGYKNA